MVGKIPIKPAAKIAVISAWVFTIRSFPSVPAQPASVLLYGRDFPVGLQKKIPSQKKMPLNPMEVARA
jgi:hypothetical protein